MSLSQQLSAPFKNPILPGFNPDPTALAVGSDYFISTSTFEFFPGHPIYHSKDLVDWKLIGHALNRPSQLPLYGIAPEGGCWAPTLRYHKGTYYLITTIRHVYTPEVRQQSRSFFVTTTDIFSNDWSDPIFIDVLGYDPDLFFDDDGTAYLTRCDIKNNIERIYGIYQATIDIVTGALLTPDKLIFNGTLPNDSASRPEGPHLYKIKDFYYLIIAEGGSTIHHQVTIQRGPSPSGPWENFAENPVIYNGIDSTQPVQFTGHADIFQTVDGAWWGVCLGTRPQGGEMARAPLGRETFLFPVRWGNGWPTFNNKQPISLSGPGLDTQSIASTTFHDDFSSPSLDLGYYYLRTPYLQFCSLIDRPGWLRLQGGAFTLGDRDQPSLMLRKQTALFQTWETMLDFSPASTRHEAGITAYYSDFYYQSIGITLCPTPALGKSSYSTRNVSIPLEINPTPINQRCILHRQIVGNTAPATSLADANITTLSYFPLPENVTGPIKLIIKAEDVRYSFGWASEQNSNITWVGAVDSKWLSAAPDGYFLFKGAQFGIYAQGGERNMLNNPAYFDYIKQHTYA